MTAAGVGQNRRLLVVPALLVVNVAVFGLMLTQSISRDPVTEIETSPLVPDWVLEPVAVAAGEWWRPLTAGFLHSHVVVLLINMLGLYELGRHLEPMLGRVRFLAVYLVALLGASAAVMLFHDPDTAVPWTVELRTGVTTATGAMCGVLGGLILVRWGTRARIQDYGSISAMLVFYLAISVIPSAGISPFAHVGGLVFGTAATAGVVFAPTRNRRTVQEVTVLGGLVVAALLAMWIGTLAYS